MFRSRMQSGVALLMVVLFLCATSLVHAAEDSYTARTEDVSAETIIVATSRRRRPESRRS